MSVASAGTRAISGVALPSVVLVQGTEQVRVPIPRTPFTLGRKTGNDLVISDARVSREHATIIFEDDSFFIVDQNSKHGTYLNGERVQRARLRRNDRIELGVCGEFYVLFDPDRPEHSSSREFLSQLTVRRPPSGTGDMETLTMFLEAARKLNTSTVLEEVLVTLIDTTLRVTKAERGYVFLRGEDGNLKLVAGRNSRGERLVDDNTISHSILHDAASSAKEFLLTDTEDFSKMGGRESIVAHNLRTVICIPLRTMQIQERQQEESTPSARNELQGVLYLDSKFTAGRLSVVSHDILRAISTEAAHLVENAFLVQAEEARKRYQQELNIAASIQQRLMKVTIPDVAFARVEARNMSSKEIGGDFFDVIRAGDALIVVVADVSGKGISAALLASILQGLLYAQLTPDCSLADIMASVNRYVCDKMGGEKYATLVLARLRPNGIMDYINCGHVPPWVVMPGGNAKTLENQNFPVGLLRDVPFEAASLKLEPESRLVVVTDGVTEAENPQGEFLGSETLNQLLPRTKTIDDIFAAIACHCAGAALSDDCTVLQLRYTGDTRSQSSPVEA